MNIRTSINPYNRVFKVADAITSVFPTLSPTTVIPSSTDGTIKLALNSHTGSSTENSMRILFYGTGADNSTFQAQVVFWSKVPGLHSQTQYFAETTSGLDLWIPEVVCNVDGTLCATTGVANTYIDNTHRFADTLTITSSTANLTATDIVSPANNTVASLSLDLAGPQMVEIIFKLGTATAMNALYRTF